MSGLCLSADGCKSIFMRIKHFILGLMAFIVGALHAMADKVVNNTDGRDATVRVMSFNIRFNNTLDTLDTSWDAR